jgi:hypothetical protein
MVGNLLVLGKTKTLFAAASRVGQIFEGSKDLEHMARPGWAGIIFRHRETGRLDTSPAHQPGPPPIDAWLEMYRNGPMKNHVFGSPLRCDRVYIGTFKIEQREI